MTAKAANAAANAANAATKKLQETYNRINIGIIITFTTHKSLKFKEIIKEIYFLAFSIIS